MSDEELRRNARDAGHDPAACLAAASGLDRAGRRAEAIELLLAGRRHAIVRDELARHAWWTHVDGDAGATRSIAAPIPRAAPRVELLAELLHDADELLVSPAGLALTGVRAGTVVLDLDDGRLLARHDAHAVCWDGDLLVDRHGVRVRWLELPGRVVASLDDPLAVVAGVRAGLLIGRGSEVLKAWRREVGGLRELWSRPVPPSPRVRDPLCAANLAVVYDPERRTLQGFDAERGALRFSVPGGDPRLDELGLVCVGPRGEVAALDSGGQPVWIAQRGDIRALDRERVLIERRGKLHLHDRVTGGEERRLDLALLQLSLLLGRELLLAWSNVLPEPRSEVGHLRAAPYLAAYDLRGQLCWALDAQALGFDPEGLGSHAIHAVAPLGGRLYLLCRDGARPDLRVIRVRP